MDIGIDLIEVKRIKQLVKNKRFVERVFTAGEVKYCNSKKNYGQHYAVRFAAKEAVWKALNRKELSHKDITVINDLSGKPKIKLSAKYNHLEKGLFISLTHTKEYASAVAICK